MTSLPEKMKNVPAKKDEKAPRVKRISKREKCFLDAYFTEGPDFMNGAAAARVAGYTNDHSTRAWELLKRPHVAAVVDRMLELA